jgi:hypothetical protein
VDDAETPRHHRCGTGPRRRTRGSGRRGNPCYFPPPPHGHDTETEGPGIVRAGAPRGSPRTSETVGVGSTHGGQRDHHGPARARQGQDSGNSGRQRAGHEQDTSRTRAGHDDATSRTRTTPSRQRTPSRQTKDGLIRSSETCTVKTRTLCGVAGSCGIIQRSTVSQQSRNTTRSVTRS